MLRNKAIKYRIYPNKVQEQQIIKTFGCCRFVYNNMLTVQDNLYKSSGKHLSKFDAFKYMTANIKSANTFLKEADSVALMNSVFSLDRAYQNFFSKRAGFPKYKSKHHISQSYTTNYTNGNVALLEKAIKLPKLGAVKAKLHRLPANDWIIKSATVSKSSDSKYYVSILFAFENVVSSIPVVHKDKCIGLDYKSDGFAVSSSGVTVGSPKYYREACDKLAKEQHKLSRKKHGSSNYYKQLQRVNTLQCHIANQRKDFLHKLSCEIANHYDAVCVESLNMSAMANKSFGNGKATLDNGYGMFLSFLEYKLDDRGKYFIKVDKWFPSSQICCRCGNTHKLSLAERTYCCPLCGNTIDRDYQAAINILNEGIKMLPIIEAKILRAA